MKCREEWGEILASANKECGPEGYGIAVENEGGEGGMYYVTVSKDGESAVFAGGLFKHEVLKHVEDAYEMVLSDIYSGSRKKVYVATALYRRGDEALAESAVCSTEASAVAWLEAEAAEWARECGVSPEDADTRVSSSRVQSRDRFGWAFSFDGTVRKTSVDGDFGKGGGAWK